MMADWKQWLIIALGLSLNIFAFVALIRQTRETGAQTAAQLRERELEQGMQRYRRESREWQALYRGLLSSVDDLIQARDRGDPNYETLKANIEERVRSRVAEARGDIDS